MARFFRFGLERGKGINLDRITHWTDGPHSRLDDEMELRIFTGRNAPTWSLDGAEREAFLAYVARWTDDAAIVAPAD